MSARIVKNGVKNEKVTAKTRFQGLICEELERKRAMGNETED